MTLPKLLGHRGIGDPFTISLGIPENSIPSIEWAAAHGAWVVEGDVQLSGPDASGNRTMFILHDDDLTRTTNGSGIPHLRPWSYIRERWLEIPRDLDGNGDYDNTKFHPPSFRSWLTAAKGTGKLVFTELKGEYWPAANIKKFCEEVAAQDMTSKIIVAGGTRKLTYVKKYLPKAKLSYSANEKPSVTTVKNLVGSGYATLSLAIAEGAATYVKNLQAAGVKVLVYTLDKDTHYQRALPLNAYGWFCDNVEHASQWLAANVT